MANNYSKILIGTLICCFTLFFAGKDSIQTAQASGVDGGNGYIAVPIKYSQGKEQLFLIKTLGENKAIMVYETKNGSGLKLVASRRINYDSEIIVYKDKSEKEYHPIVLKRALEKGTVGEEPR